MTTTEVTAVQQPATEEAPWPHLRIGWFNVANAGNDERSANHRYGLRHGKVIEAIRAANLDVVCLLELRECLNADGNGLWHASQIADDIAVRTELRVAMLMPQSLHQKSFWRVTLFNPRTVTALGSHHTFAIVPVVDSDRGEDRGAMFMLSAFMHKRDKKIFEVVNAHFPFALDKKLRCIAVLNTFKPTLTGRRPLLLGGDMNTFADDGGPQMLDEFARCWTRLSSGEISFRSFPHDSYQGESALDHIFLLKESQEIFDEYFVRVDGAMAHDTGASDHFLMVLDLLVKPNKAT